MSVFFKSDDRLYSSRKVFIRLFLFVTLNIVISTCVSCTRDVLLRGMSIDYNDPLVCDCTDRSYPIKCRTLTDYYKIEYNIVKGDKPDEFILKGIAEIVDEKHFNVTRRDMKNRFYLYLFKNGTYTERIPLLRQGNRSSVRLSGTIPNNDFDAVALGYHIFVHPY